MWQIIHFSKFDHVRSDFRGGISHYNFQQNHSMKHKRTVYSPLMKKSMHLVMNLVEQRTIEPAVILFANQGTNKHYIGTHNIGILEVKA